MRLEASGRGDLRSSALVHPFTRTTCSEEFFADSEPLQDLDEDQSRDVRKALATFVPNRLDSAQHLRLLALQLEGRNMLVIQRASSEMAEQDGRLKFIFAIGSMEQGRFRVLHWTENKLPQEERVLGTIGLKDGREFLITVVSDPESHSFRVYGIRNGALVLIFSGGGSSC